MSLNKYLCKTENLVRMSRIPRIEVPSPVVRRIDPPEIRNIPPPVVRGIQPPVIDVPSVTIEYPTIDIQTEQEFEQQMSPPPQQQQTQEVEEDTRDLPDDPVTPPTPPVPVTPPPPTPTITIGGVEAPLPEPAPLITAGATAMVTTAVTLTATILIGKFKDAILEPMMKRMEASSRKKKKIKIKQVKPVLHYVLNEDSTVDILEYSQKGTKVVGQTDDVERYIRDQVENDSLYEMDNKIIIDDVIKEKFTKEGAKRFKSLFAPAKSIAKKLSAKFTI